MNLIGTFDVEEKARAKNTRGHGNDGGSSAHVVHNKNFHSHKNREKGSLSLSKSLLRLSTSRRRTTGNVFCAVVLIIILILRTARTLRINNSTNRKSLLMLLLAMLKLQHQIYILCNSSINNVLRLSL